MTLFKYIAGLVLLAVLSTNSQAAPSYCPEVTTPELDLPLRIGTKFSPPFVMGPKTKPYGLSIDFWTLIASCLALETDDYVFIEYGTADALINAAANYEVDLSIAALSITAARETNVDFSHRYFEASLGSLVASRNSAANFGLLVARILQSNLLNIILGLLAFMFVVAVYYWWTERKNGNDFFRGGPLKGFYRALIWSMLLVFQGQGDPFSLNTRFGQLFVLFLMFFGVTIISSFTAVITSSLTLQALEPEITNISDLSNKTVSVKSQSVAADWAQGQRIFVEPMQTFPQVQRKFDEGTVDVFIHDREILQYLVTSGTLENVKLAPLTMEPQDYAIAFPQNSVLREAVNVSLLGILDDPVWQTYLEKYLGKSE